MNVLVLTSEPIGAEALRSVLGGEPAETEVMVVAPALSRSALRFWMSDADEAIAHADEVQEETVERLSEEGVDAAGDTGESDPLLALQDALATFRADRIVVFSHPADDFDYGEQWLAEAGERFGVPVERGEVTR